MSDGVAIVLYIVVAIVWAYIAVRISGDAGVAVLAVIWPAITPFALLLLFGEWVARRNR